MYLYWRIQQDLDCMGEVITFHDPRFARSFRTWVRRNITGLLLATDLDMERFLRPNMN